MGARPDVLRPAGSIRVVVAKLGLDGHDVGARVVARGLMDAGMEVIYTGLRRTPEQVVATALQEDADAIGVSSLSGAHVPLIRRLCADMRARGLEDVLVLAGGVIPDADEPLLAEAGVAKIFHPATTLDEIVDYIRAHVRPLPSGAAPEAR